MNKSLRKKRENCHTFPLDKNQDLFSSSSSNIGGIPPSTQSQHVRDIIFPPPYMLTRSVSIITFSYSSLNFRDNENMNNDCRATSGRKKAVKDLSLNMCFYYYFVACQNRRKNHPKSFAFQPSPLTPFRKLYSE
jgi:hypothetical protein